jgi:spore coat protein CotF
VATLEEILLLSSLLSATTVRACISTNITLKRLLKDAASKTIQFVFQLLHVKMTKRDYIQIPGCLSCLLYAP